MTQFSKLKAGDILGESQYYKVVKVAGNKVQLNNGSDIVVDKEYVEKFLTSGDQFESTEKKTKTELAELVLSNPRTVMTVAFFKQDVPKTKKAYEAELAKRSEEVKEDFLKRGLVALTEALKNPVLDFTPGALRVMRGHHDGGTDDMGRVVFTDMDITEGSNLRTIDPRTIQYVVVKGVKYELKK